MAAEAKAFDVSGLTREEREILIRKSEADEDFDVYTRGVEAEVGEGWMGDEAGSSGRVVVPNAGERDNGQEGEGGQPDARSKG